MEALSDGSPTTSGRWSLPGSHFGFILGPCLAVTLAKLWVRSNHCRFREAKEQLRLRHSPPLLNEFTVLDGVITPQYVVIRADQWAIAR
jgi:hypothetical protein